MESASPPGIAQSPLGRAQRAEKKHQIGRAEQEMQDGRAKRTGLHQPAERADGTQMKDGRASRTVTDSSWQNEIVNEAIEPNYVHVSTRSDLVVEDTHKEFYRRAYERK
jgi:hypothetical protein